MPYVMGGFPTLEQSLRIGQACAQAGADVIELGMPYSDPLADGPVIHAAGTRALQAGARAYLLKGMTTDDLVSTIRAVHSGRSHIPPAIAQRLAERVGTEELTPREFDVLEQIVHGCSNKEIATALDISEATVKTHINSLLGKLGVTDRTQAATAAIQRGIVSLD